MNISKAHFSEMPKRCFNNACLIRSTFSCSPKNNLGNLPKQLNPLNWFRDGSRLVVSSCLSSGNLGC